jgi:uncharacterized delta-60 repeat protein
LTLAVLAAQSWAAAGDLDPTFSGNGRVMFGFPHSNHSSDGYGLAVQRKRKIVVVGTTAGGSYGTEFAVARLNPNGSLDRRFAGDGRRRVGPANCIFSGGGLDAVAIQGDGKVVVAGYACRGLERDKPEFILTRLNPNGSLDRRFARRGRLRIPFKHPRRNLVSRIGMAIQGDGKIVVVGTMHDDMAVARVKPSGGLDRRFSGNGRATIGFRHEADGEAVAIQDDGKIVMAGTSTTGAPGGYRMALARLRPNGKLDRGFSGDGRLAIGFGTPDAEGTSVAVQGDGRIVAAGLSRRYNPDRARFAVARLNADGSPDPSFSGDGRQTAGFGSTGDAIAFGVALQGDGRSVLAGNATRRPDGRTRFALARFKANGELDPSFSGNGRQTTQFGKGGSGSEGAAAFGLAIQGDGKIVAAGDGTPRGFRSSFAVARYKAS